MKFAILWGRFKDIYLSELHINEINDEQAGRSIAVKSYGNRIILKIMCESKNIIHRRWIECILSNFYL